MKTRDKIKRHAIEADYDLEVVWECAIRKELSKNQEMQEFFKTCVFEVVIIQSHCTFCISFYFYIANLKMYLGTCELPRWFLWRPR